MNVSVDMNDISQSDFVEPKVPAYDARSLTQEDGLARIVLDGKVYSLRITRANKLILTK